MNDAVWEALGREGHKYGSGATGRWRTAGAPALAGALAAVGGACVLAGLVAWMGAVPVLALLVALAASAVLVLRPGIATLLTAFLLYINFPALLTKQHDMPASVAGAFILLLGFPLVHALVIRRDRLRADATFGLMLAFLAVLLLSTLGAVDTGIALDRVQQFVAEGLLLYWLVVNTVREMRTIRRLLWVLLGAACLLSALSLYQDVTGSYTQEFGGLAYRNYDESADGTQTQAVRTRRTWDRAQGPVDEPNRFAQILIVLVPLAAFLFRTGRSRTTRLAALAAGALVLAGIAITLSRGALVGLAAMAVAMVAVRWIRPWHVLAGALALLAVAPVISPFFLDRLYSIVNAGYLLGGDESQYQNADGAMRGRTTEMLAALHVFRDHPVLGVGPGQFSRFYFTDYAKNADIKFRDIAVPRRAHNLYLELAAEYGAVGLALFLAIVLALMRALWRARRELLQRSGHEADLCAALWLSLMAYLVTGVFLHLSYQRYYWFLLAIASAALHLAHARRRQSTPTYEEETPWLPLRS